MTLPRCIQMLLVLISNLVACGASYWYKSVFGNCEYTISTSNESIGPNLALTSVIVMLNSDDIIEVDAERLKLLGKIREAELNIFPLFITPWAVHDDAKVPK